MNTENFVRQIRQSVIEENTQSYRQIFEDTEATVTSEYWIRANTLFHSLNHEQQDVLIEIMRQVSIDTISTIFGIIDGVCWFDEQNHCFQFICDKNDMAGELQDSFLKQYEV